MESQLTDPERRHDHLGRRWLIGLPHVRCILLAILFLGLLVSCSTTKELSSEAADAQFNLANRLYRDGEYHLAVSAYLRAEELLPGDFSQGYNLAIALSRIGDHVGSESQISALAKRFPDRASDLERLRGWIRWYAGDLNGASDIYMTLVTQAPFDRDLVYASSRIAIDLERYDDAIATLTDALDRLSLDSTMTLLLAEASEGAGKVQEAFQWYLASLLEDSASQQAFEGLHTLLNTFDDDEMVTAGRRLFDIFPHEPRVLAFLAKELLARDLDDGVVILEQALKSGYKDKVDLIQILRNLQAAPSRVERVAALYRDYGVTESIQGIMILAP